MPHIFPVPFPTFSFPLCTVYIKSPRTQCRNGALGYRRATREREGIWGSLKGDPKIYSIPRWSIRGPFCRVHTWLLLQFLCWASLSVQSILGRMKLFTIKGRESWEGGWIHGIALPHVHPFGESVLQGHEFTPACANIFRNTYLHREFF